MKDSSKRNKPCPCGSGKKYKFCCLEKKQSITSVKIDLGEPREVQGFGILPDGSIQLFSQHGYIKPQRISIETHYEREKNNKILNKSDVSSFGSYIDPTLNLLRFNKISAIDTGTIIVDGTKLSVTAVIHAMKRVENCRIVLDAKEAFSVEFRNLIVKEENYGLMYVIKLLDSLGNIKQNDKIGIIIDFDLGLIDDYNRRIKPISGDYYLPECVQLLYASADAGKRHVQNKLISYADSLAKRMIKKISSDINDHSGLVVEVDKPMSHSRTWTPTSYVCR